MKFSIIVPVYNVEKYIAKCLESALNQTYKGEYEIIVVNDGTKDNSQDIIDEYKNKYPEKIKSFIKENGGLSDARNYGIERATGEYIIFLDSDDYVDEKLLEIINDNITENDLDVFGYNLKFVDENGECVGRHQKNNFGIGNGEEAIISLVNSKNIFEPAAGFACRLEYWKEKKFQFTKNIYHEDFALMPLVVLEAKKVKCIDYDGYFYVQTQGSIMRDTNKEKEKKKSEDLIKCFDILKEAIEAHQFQNEYSKKLLYAYIANELIYKLENLDEDIKAVYKEELVKRKIKNYIINDSVKRKIRKMMIVNKFKL